MKAVLGWVGRKGILFAILVLAIGFYTLFWPSISEGLSADRMSIGDVRQEIALQAEEAQSALEETGTTARTLPAETLEDRLAERQKALAQARRALDDASDGLLAAYRPSRILARKRAEIDIALAEREIAVLETALGRRSALDAVEARAAEYARIPTEAAIAASNRICRDRRADVARFDERSRVVRGVRNALLDERQVLLARSEEACRTARERAERRTEGLAWARQLREAREAFREAGAIAANPLPESFTDDIAGNTIRDILVKAFIALLLISLTPLLVRLLMFYVVAPIAQRRPSITLGMGAPANRIQPSGPSTTSAAIRLGEGEELLVRQDYLQSTSMEGVKRTQWLLDWRHPLASIASGMTFLTRIRGSGETTTVSPVKDPFAEVTVLTLPEGGCCVLRPSALAAAVQREGEPMRITSHWRLFSIAAWLTFQLRYLVFHGPARLVIKGGRGIRVERAERGRIFSQAQLAGFSTDLAYAVTRTETFWPYFFGRESLLKDRVSAGQGVLIVEEAPMAGKRGGLTKGIQGVIDAMLKGVGI
ncbi:hypothetical protein [Qipengyuania sp. JC766]|uniref:hypothetical protein n=1 Tax=Qipengyuania sp. JC766 TaxID=3232139 RepID=UPI0034585F15